MGVIIFLSLVLLASSTSKDPAPGWNRTVSEARNMDCERLDGATASRRYPGRIQAPGARGDNIERSALVCRERIMAEGLRPAQDEAVLTGLDAAVSGFAAAAGSLRPDLAERTWLVEAHYPSAPVSSKIAFAAKNALNRQGLQVSDRALVLSAGDVYALTRLDPTEAWPAACRRYAATGALGDGDALLAVVMMDARETALHAGICEQGRWVWLQ